MCKLYNAKYSGALEPSRTYIYDGAFLQKDGAFLPFTIFAEKLLR